jgi:hypothetical protein
MRTLKAPYHVKWNTWMTNEPHTVTAQGNIRSLGMNFFHKITNKRFNYMFSIQIKGMRT